MAGFLLINPRSGDDEPGPEELRAEAAARGIETRLLEPEDDLAELARAADADVLGMAGGDGSLGAVAAVALERDLPFVVVPFGTRNHFARDLGLDNNDPLGALEAFTGRERRIDVGTVGDRVFLNNVSLGLYARLVHRREEHRRRRRLLARGRALWTVVQRRHGLEVRVDGAPVAARVILVANNAYELDLFDVGARNSLTEGTLHLYVASGWLPGTWEDRPGERFRIEGDERLQAAVDGEPAELQPPIELEVRPQALRVLVPGAPGG
ncbi:MAG: hypothetical protein M3R70_08290 [Actinomycetota bacterium]|nr:hypothetical protein [Actinomycetota bacterium]